MFQLENIDAVEYRKKTRQATIKIMALFIVIGFITATLAVEWFGAYSNNKLVLNFIGAFIGLMITAMIVKTFFADKAWMKEAIYSWRLKRHLMMITNKIRPIQEAAQHNDSNALKVMRFYHLGLQQMHKLEDNNAALLDIKAEIKELEDKINELGLEANQDHFDPSWIESYHNH
ncbi:DUF3087 family protein [Thiomicrorhabdus sediminis]|uniref:DUF3087 family protein n=1 Tax=Thiomicrorhabdus sediminis TaxID=2580412 RepID=A0A4V1HHU3_9GAMM|nr:DUF3087 family protein [Thiomicrorhabdus sediminis]QCU90223.1 DUF3087 family protein [Thiomicrorhabdus sediminis]